MGYYEENLYESFVEQMNPTEIQKPAMEEEEPFNEEYIGKLPEFIKVSELFDKMIEKAKVNPNKINPNEWKENEQICTILAKVFGVKRVWFYWIPENSRNAFTLTASAFLILGNAKDFIKHTPGRGFYDTSHTSVITLYGYCGILLQDSHLTGSELTAIFLHELGHNFDFSPYCHMKFLASEVVDDIDFSIEEHNRIKMGAYDAINDEYERHYTSTTGKVREKEINEYNKKIDEYMNSKLSKNLISSIKKIIKIPIKTITSIPKQIKNLESKKGEQFADSFATAYGYGPELISGLIKLGEFDNVQVRDTRKSTLFFRDLNNCLTEIILGIEEIHGTDQERCKECIKKLRKDLANSEYPKGMKQDLENEINQLEEIYIKLLTSTPNDRQKITKRWRRICDKLFGGAFNIAKWFKPNQM